MTADPADDALTAAYAACEAAVREHDRDRWLAILFAPAAARPHLHALYAFSLEIARVRALVSEPLPGEMRHQWWRDAIEGETRGGVKSHPIAAALIATISRFRLPRVALTDLIEARAFDLYDDPMPTLHDLEGYCGETSSRLISLAALILANGEPTPTADAAGHAGVAYAIAGLLRALPWHTARGQLYIPLDALAARGVGRDDMLAGLPSPPILEVLGDLRGHARRHLAAALPLVNRVPPAVAPAFLPVFLVEPYLHAMERRGYDPFRAATDVPQWRRQWALWRGSLRAGARPS